MTKPKLCYECKLRDCKCEVVFVENRYWHVEERGKLGIHDTLKLVQCCWKYDERPNFAPKHGAVVCGCRNPKPKKGD